MWHLHLHFYWSQFRLAHINVKYQVFLVNKRLKDVICPPAYTLEFLHLLVIDFGNSADKRHLLLPLQLPMLHQPFPVALQLINAKTPFSHTL